MRPSTTWPRLIHLPGVRIYCSQGSKWLRKTIFSFRCAILPKAAINFIDGSSSLNNSCRNKAGRTFFFTWALRNIWKNYISTRVHVVQWFWRTLKQTHTFFLLRFRGNVCFFFFAFEGWTFSRNLASIKKRRSKVLSANTRVQTHLPSCPKWGRAIKFKVFPATQRGGEGVFPAPETQTKPPPRARRGRFGVRLVSRLLAKRKKKYLHLK